MTLKVIGAGFGRTGTLSLKTALEELGYGKCYHMTELLQHPHRIIEWEKASQGQPVDWDVIFDGYQATVDYPSYRYYRQLMDYYPNAKVILTIRDAESWYESTLNTIYGVKPSLFQKLLMTFKLPFSSKLRKIVRIFKMADADLWFGDLQGNFEDKKFAISHYNQHNEEVKRIVPPERLLVYSVKEGWEPLCRFLNVPIPTDKPFPKVNSRTEFPKLAEKVFS